MTTNSRTVVLVDAAPEVIEVLQRQFPQNEFLSKDVDPESISGREVKILGYKAGKQVQKTIKDIVQDYAKDRYFVAVQEVIDDVLKIGRWPFRHVYERQVADVMSKMGWKRSHLRNGPYRKTAYVRPVTASHPPLPPPKPISEVNFDD